MSVSLPGKPTSLWMDTTPETDYPALQKGLSVDVAVVGGGIAGLATAALLKRAGKTVAVIENDTIGAGATGFTTGKASSLQQIVYQDIAAKFGKDGARKYGEANQAAIDQIVKWVETENIECDFAYQPNYTFAQTEEEVEAVRKEAELAKELGLPAEFTADVPVPFETKGAVKFDKQARLHARKLLLGLARIVWGNGSYVFERTRAVDVEEGESCVVKTEKETIEAGDVVVATNVPFLDRGLFFTRSHPHRSYLIAARIAGKLPSGMYISAGDPTRSILPFTIGRQEYLLVGGEGHKTGEKGSVSQRYRDLADYATAHFPVTGITHRWATQDGIPVDKVPYVGKINPFSKHVYVITGLRKWGLTNGVVGGMILRDQLTGQRNAWAGLYNSNRLKPLAGGRKFITENLDTGLKFVTRRLKGGGNLADLMPGEGQVVRSGGKQVAAYKDDDGKVHTVSAACTHLQCIVEFNDAEKTWDCPCHGSRFDTSGKVIQGPATKDLEKRKG